MLTTATIGMACYGLYSVLVGASDLFGAARLEWWADLWLVAAGAMLVLGGAFVRVSMPGGLALAVGGLFALQSISLHNAVHLHGQLLLMPQLARAILAGSLVALAYLGWESDNPQTSESRDYEKQHKN